MYSLFVHTFTSSASWNYSNIWHELVKCSHIAEPSVPLGKSELRGSHWKKGSVFQWYKQNECSLCNELIEVLSNGSSEVKYTQVGTREVKWSLGTSEARCSPCYELIEVLSNCSHKVGAKRVLSVVALELYSIRFIHEMRKNFSRYYSALPYSIKVN